MYLFFDTETTGLPDYNKALTDPAQPYIVQLALLLADEDGRELLTWKAPVTPEGFKIDEDGRAYVVNKISNRIAGDYGVLLKQQLAMFKLFESRASLKVAHNYRFDGFLMKCAHARVGVEPISPAIDKFCTMKVAEELKRQGIIQRATLGAFYKHATGKDLENAHDALADVRACKDVFFWTLKQGLYKPQPRVVPGQAA